MTAPVMPTTPHHDHPEGPDQRGRLTGRDGARCRNGRFTLLLSEAEVRTPEGPLFRLVAFVSKEGLPERLQEELNAQGVTIFEASDFERHAEIAAQNYRKDVAAQEEDLGGPISKVNQAVINNGACTVECAQGLTGYIGREDVTIQVGDRGYYDGQVLTPQYMADLRSEFGGVSNYEALIQDFPLGDLAAGDAGQGIEP